LLIAIVAFSFWRIDGLKEKAGLLAGSLARHIAVNEELRRDNNARDIIATDATNEAIENEREIAREMRTISNEEDGPCAPVLCNTVNRLLSSSRSANSDP
jgi:hypothetical protein